jgi:hypothetical protein
VKNAGRDGFLVMFGWLVGNLFIRGLRYVVVFIFGIIQLINLSFHIKRFKPFFILFNIIDSDSNFGTEFNIATFSILCCYVGEKNRIFIDINKLYFAQCVAYYIAVISSSFDYLRFIADPIGT